MLKQIKCIFKGNSFLLLKLKHKTQQNINSYQTIESIFLQSIQFIYKYKLIFNSNDTLTHSYMYFETFGVSSTAFVIICSKYFISNLSVFLNNGCNQ